MLILSQVLYLRIKRSDYTNVFDQSLIKYDKEVCIELSHGFEIKWEEDYVDCLNSALYGMINFTQWWFDMLYIGLQACIMYPSYYTLCVFM